jgi:hypothetical protein
MFNPGDKVTIKRGKGGSQEAEILTAADASGQYAVKLPDGSMRLVKADNLKAPVESTIGEGRLAAEIQTAIGDMDVTTSAQDILQAFVSRLSREMPGLAARVSWPAESADEIQR